MKAAIFTVLALGTLIALGREIPSSDPNGPRFTPEQLARIRAENKAKADRASGGRIVKPGTMKGKILFINCQDTVPVTKVEEVASNLAKTLKMNIGVSRSDSSSLKGASETLRNSGANLGVIMTECGDETPLMLVAPECKWAIVNTSKLGRENKEERLQREALRAFMFIAGGLCSQYPNNLTEPVTSVEQLDDYAVPQLPMDLTGRFKNYLPKLGVTPATIISYKKACMEGWAPAPTNEIQKAVWEQVHAIPQKPIKIEFDPKTDTK